MENVDGNNDISKANNTDIIQVALVLGNFIYDRVTETTVSCNEVLRCLLLYINILLTLLKKAIN